MFVPKKMESEKIEMVNKCYVIRRGVLQSIIQPCPNLHFMTC